MIDKILSNIPVFEEQTPLLKSKHKYNFHSKTSFISISKITIGEQSFGTQLSKQGTPRYK